MTKTELVEKSVELFGEKYDYRYVSSNFKTTDYVDFVYNELIFTQKAMDHLKGKAPETIRVRNTRDFINKSKLLWGLNKYDYSLCEFVNNRQKVKLIYRGKVYQQWPLNHLQGFKCENVWDTEKFIIESKKIFKDKYDYSLTEYKGFHKPLKLIYNGTVYEQKPEHHFRGNLAENCHRSKKLDKDKFIQKSKEIFSDRYDYSLVEYVNAKTKVKIIYEGEIYEQIAQQHLAGLRPEGLNAIDTKTFIEKAKTIHKDRYDYSLVEYKNRYEDVKILYKGSLYLQKPSYHLRGDRPEKKCFRKTTEEFICESNLVHDFTYSYEKVKYIKSSIKIIITCRKHGDFLQTPNSHLQGIGCPSCHESKGESEIARLLNKKGINYSRQHKFENCKNKHRLPFDFYIPSVRTCIEFDGKQHYEPVSLFGGVETFEKLKNNDRIKESYCEDNYIDLIRIRYDQINKIEDILWNSLKGKLIFS